ncbi:MULTISPECIES: ABC transporter permease [Agrobacterium]|jgi:peptide/nickel transport system permease protein|uniref:ABC transporter permease n=1 Tax=Agrobacterium tumefaciens TaxID=358 RepID=UPI000DD00EDD|nr:ABC transporter permease [Agrobacterium tumefaciens]MDP9564312.1 peptide/nickel transport system permease protein [Rhizobium nepotum]MDX8327537.1 ABC transporter permease [Agrobacterium tumefaciens]MEA1844897.1 ABC transporter permease [Agrobacterium tumefaciens]MRH98282.1 ABC transporter permease subunit [Agrobacterium tumefaciens]NSZ76785.1 ABC transporter permease [Agrobacterium tumefaciens]
MLKFALSRLLSAVPTLFIVSVAVFGLIRLIPGDPASLMLGDLADADALAAARRSMGLDKPVPLQFVIWLGNAVQGDLGHSVLNGQPVLDLVLQRFSTSAWMVLIAVGLSVLIAVPLGMAAAWKQNGGLDLAIVAMSTLLLSIPTFWLGLMILLGFGLKLGWLPVLGYVSVTDDPIAGLIYLIMPVATLVLHEVGIIVRMARASTLDVLRLDYITHARAKGLGEAAVLLRHAARNAFGPTWTLIGLVLGNLLGGVAVVETVFTIPGLGRLIVDSIYARDYAVVQGCLLFVAVTYLLVNLLVDLLYPLFDPRVTAE